MNHYRARRLLGALPDGTLEPKTESKLRAHLEGCRTCRRALRRIEAADQLLSRIPRSLVPLDAPALADSRLASLAQWGPRPTPVGGAYGPMPAVCSLAAAVLIFVLGISVSSWAPVMGDFGTSTLVASAMPDTNYLPSIGWR